jgi:hypothetical protein
MKNLFLILIACTFACTTPSCKREVASNKYDLDSFPPLNPHELFKKIDVVVLDSIPDQPIYAILKIVYHNNLLYIQDYQRANLLVYSETGKFVRSIGSKGRGPGELEDVRDFQINRFTGNIEILGNPSPSIMIYDTKGNFIKKRNIHNRFLTIDKFYHINNDLTAWLALGEDYKISVYSEKLNKIVHEYSLGMDRAFMGVFHYRKPFSHYGNLTFFFDTYSNTIYKFNVEKLEFEVHQKLDFNKHNFDKSLLPNPQEWMEMVHSQRLDFAKKIRKNTLELDQYFETDEYSVLSKLNYNILTQKKDNSVIQFNSLTDSIRFNISDMNNKFVFSSFSLIRIDEVLNESMVGKEVYTKLKELSLEDKHKEKYGIIKYWFK